MMNITSLAERQMGVGQIYGDFRLEQSQETMVKRLTFKARLITHFVDGSRLSSEESKSKGGVMKPSQFAIDAGDM